MNNVNRTNRNQIGRRYHRLTIWWPEHLPIFKKNRSKKTQKESVCENFIASPINLSQPSEDPLWSLFFSCSKGVGARALFSEQCNNNQIKSAQHMVYVVVCVCVFFSFIFIPGWNVSVFLVVAFACFVFFFYFRSMSWRSVLCLRHTFSVRHAENMRGRTEVPSCFWSLSALHLRECVVCKSSRNRRSDILPNK